MRVAVDATPLILSSGGLARYTLELSQALATEFPGDEYFLVSDQKFALPPWAGEEITFDPRYGNSRLARSPMPHPTAGAQDGHPGGSVGSETCVQLPPSCYG